MSCHIDPETHLLTETPHRASPDSGGVITPEAIVIHYTGGGRAAGSIDWLTRADDVYVSAHVVMDRDGSITQLVPFNRRAFHAGRSAWNGRSALNDWSIGIELANYGVCLEQPDGSVRASTGAEIARGSALRAAHKHGGPVVWWERFPEAQIDACARLCVALMRAYPIDLVLGHDDVAPGRKVDPGPAFDLDAFRVRVAVCGGSCGNARLDATGL
ncbi:MAG TPA: N-acetylmuramoyl-L-alanine amidase [Candidatus Hydrogenedentes bacterium]|nr:N-acetylmuramoyl-L-alanine amidase [Candidatus Hydrogenedentota bacterium]HOS02680.1 N-acetylmuramoyl-L-alanine amidase [Candidatus Hydrogenedentota bacterium]